MKQTLEICFITALSCEARPLIDRYRLKRDMSETALQIYRGDGVHLVVSDVGKLPAATATASLLARLDRKQLLAVNLGAAGATGHGEAQAQSLGCLSRIHRIVDAETGREYFPDLLPVADCPEAGLTTVPRGLTMAERHTVATELVDMEAAGFFVAAATFLPPQRILCLKLVSDKLEPEHITPAGVEGLVSKQIPAVEAILQNYRSVLATPLPEALSEDEQKRLDKVTVALRLTVSQQVKLTNWARNASLHGGDVGNILDAFTHLACDTKAEGKHQLEELRKRLVGA